MMKQKIPIEMSRDSKELYRTLAEKWAHSPFFITAHVFRTCPVFFSAGLP
jgi:hypothetical protein